MKEPGQTTSLHQTSLRSSILAKGYVDTYVFRYISIIARSRVLSVLRSGIVIGFLQVKDQGEVYQFGKKGSGGSPSLELRVLHHNFWIRVLLSHDLGVAEAYMQRDFEVSDLKDLLNLWLDNRGHLAGLENGISRLFAYYSAFAINTLGRQSMWMAQQNVETAYDTSNSLFQTFLSKEMMYSCAIWGEEENGVGGDLTVGPIPGDLEAAQQRKIKVLLSKARLLPGDHLLEIGSGWGALAVQAALMGCDVDTITLSSQQMDMVKKVSALAGVSDRVRVHLCDYRQLPAEFKHAFDALIACEMIEAVGPKNMSEFFRMADWALKDHRAAMVITSTSRPESRYTPYQADDFARHYHWPNTHLPSATSLAVSVQEAVPGKFVLYNLEDHGAHYPRTLREWGRRFERNFRGDIIRELQMRHPQLCNETELEAFRRKWRYMFIYAEVGFARAYTSLNCWTFARPENVVSYCG